MMTPTDYEDPCFEAKGTVHEWKNYISKEVAEMWSTFTKEQRASLARQADEIADREDWD